ncbi:unnamed protein product [Protopolystoma xenopodis]|uniref:Transporter n=1 Tax=Protopolystoma xenopodis TaxID=117903 RepID=A0A3S5AFA1_9PLAT|nr:unnamed protein product [Protopolystoma xenopodis]
MLIFGALPTLYMELLLGQRMGKGAIGIWDMCPIFRGIGLAQVTMAFLVALFYNTIIAWSFYFFFASITTRLPWLHCNPFAGSSPECRDSAGIALDRTDASNVSLSSTEYFE